MTMSIHAYPMCCTGFVLHDFFSKTKEDQLKEIYEILVLQDKRPANSNQHRTQWRSEGHCSAVTMEDQLPGRAALDEIGFMRNSDEEAYMSTRYNTGACHHSISVKNLAKWIDSYKEEYDKQNAKKIKIQKSYKEWVEKSKQALTETIENV